MAQNEIITMKLPSFFDICNLQAIVYYLHLFASIVYLHLFTSMYIYLLFGGV